MRATVFSRLIPIVSDHARTIDRVAERLRPHYRRFLEPLGGEILLTGHSHQAWPDVSRDAQLAAWDDAARLIDGKWEKVLGEVLGDFRAHVAGRIGTARRDDLAVGANTHELVYRLLTCFDRSARVLTTDAEFHSLRRQLARSSEAGLRVTRIPVEPDHFTGRFIDALDREQPDLAALSYVLFTTSRTLDLEPILRACAERDIPVLVDAYHAFNVIELKVDRWPGTVFVTGGGYKYAQTGEGACWLLLPEDAERFRPEFTGWFADFDHLEAPDDDVGYGPGGFRFFGATFDPTALYRGNAVFRFMDEQGLTAPALREISLAATSLLIEAYDRHRLAARGLELLTPRSPERRGGFVTVRRADAASIRSRLQERGVRTDVRGDLLRLGPAPYLTSREIQRGVEILAEIA